MTAVNGSAQRAPAGRASLVADGALAAVLAGVLPVASYFAARHQAGHRPLDAWAIALVIASAAALALRRRYPVAVLALVFGTTLAYFVLGYAEGPIWLALITAYYSAVTGGRRLAAGIAAVAGFAIFPWLDYVLRSRPAPNLTDLAGLAAWLLVVLGAGEAVRVRRIRATAAALIRAEEARRRAGEERLRMARELHDSLGHYLSLISVQSGVALNLNLNPQLPERARAALAAVRRASKDALGELRSALAILRQDGEAAPRSPASGLARLGELVSQASVPGLEVRAETKGKARPLPFGVDAAGYRIVQEALTNARRHAGPATATVRVTYGEEDLTVQVDDDGRGPAARPAPAAGNGIAGMRERVSALGGELFAGPRPGGGFRVRARLPVNGVR